MTINCYRDAYDSSLLRKECYKVHILGVDQYTERRDLESELSQIPLHSMVVVITEHHPAILQKLQEFGFRIINTKNIYCRKVGDHFKIRKQCGIDLLAKNEIVQKYALSAFHDLYSSLVKNSRYRKDNEIPQSKSLEVYEKWFENSIYGDFADEVLIATSRKKILGLIALKLRKQVGYLDLLVVDPSEKRKGIGQYLLLHSLLHFQKTGIQKVCTETEGENVEANRFYQKNGFLIQAHHLVFHKHNI